MLRAEGQGLLMTVASEQDRDVAPMPVSNMAACTRPAKTQHGYKKGPSPRRELEVVMAPKGQRTSFCFVPFLSSFFNPSRMKPRS